MLECDVMYDSENDRECLPEEIEEDTDEQSSDCSDIERPTKRKDYCQIKCCIAPPPCGCTHHRHNSSSACCIGYPCCCWHHWHSPSSAFCILRYQWNNGMSYINCSKWIRLCVATYQACIQGICSINICSTGDELSINCLLYINGSKWIMLCVATYQACDQGSLLYQLLFHLPPAAEMKEPPRRCFLCKTEVDKGDTLPVSFLQSSCLPASLLTTVSQLHVNACKYS